MKIFKSCLALIIAYIICFSCCVISSFAADIRPVKSDTWVATDELGRVTPLNNETGNVKEDKYVGIFYFLFLGSKKEESVLDITYSYKRGGLEAVWEDMLSGSGMFFWTN